MPRKILIVEDEAISALYLRNEFKTHNFDVCKIASTGLKALAIAKEENPDVVLMDICLVGDLDGIEASQQIVDNLNIPIIFMTGYSTKEYKKRAEGLRPLGYFVKPIIIENVINLINSKLS